MNTIPKMPRPPLPYISQEVTSVDRARADYQRRMNHLLAESDVHVDGHGIYEHQTYSDHIAWVKQYWMTVIKENSRCNQYGGHGTEEDRIHNHLDETLMLTHYRAAQYNRHGGEFITLITALSVQSQALQSQLVQMIDTLEDMNQSSFDVVQYCQRVQDWAHRWYCWLFEKTEVIMRQKGLSAVYKQCYVLVSQCYALDIMTYQYGYQYNTLYQREDIIEQLLMSYRALVYAIDIFTYVTTVTVDALKKNGYDD